MKISHIPCALCSMRHFGLCPVLLKILSEQLEAHSPKQFSFQAKNYLYHQGDLNQGNYILKEGWMLLSRVGEDGMRQVLRIVLPGDLLGFQPDLKGPYIDSALTLTDSVICVIPDLEKICRSNPALGVRLAWVSACDMMLTESYLASIAHKSARDRIAFMILELFLRLKMRGLNQGFKIQFPLKQEDIADALGLTNIHVNRTLKELKQERLLSIEKHELTIHDYNALYDMVGSQLEPVAACDIAPL